MKRTQSLLLKIVGGVVIALPGSGLVVPALQAQTTFTVNTATDQDDGACDAVHCSLREAINTANRIHAFNNASGIQRIGFNISGSGPHTIRPSYLHWPPFPMITATVVIDGYTQPGAVPATATTPATLQIVLDGEIVDDYGNVTENLRGGLEIDGSNSVVRGLVIHGFEHGIRVRSSGNIIEGNRIGTNVGGTRLVGNDSGGVAIYGGSDNTVGGRTPASRNIISGSGLANVFLFGGNGNVVLGNYIGTDVSGTIGIGRGSLNDNAGVLIDNLAGETGGHIIGGSLPGSRNIISGNNGAGVRIRGGSGHVVQGNYIGTDVSGTTVVANEIGVAVESPANAIGSTAMGAGNVISGNFNYGVWIRVGSGNVIQGNNIGTDVSGTTSVANRTGVVVESAANIIGGAIVGARNVISGNIFSGLVISHQTLVQGNFIGTDATGTADLGNGESGIVVDGPDNLVGGAATALGNIISGNRHSGVWIAGLGAHRNVVAGNYIGTNASGSSLLGNSGFGILINDGFSNTVGGTSPEAGNVIARNGEAGIRITSNRITAITATRNRILGNAVHGNTDVGIDLQTVDDPTFPLPDPPGALLPPPAQYQVSPNDAGDGDLGPNQVQNFPRPNSRASVGFTPLEAP